ncbi:MAG: hypothetical protein Q9227_002914 [Pyrenula ochraceoflavens]
MVDPPPQQSQKTNLRSSCDGCGTAKVKCDRGLPHCGRCLSLGVNCVYGVSRKKGKPPRGRLRDLKRASSSQPLHERASNLNGDRTNGHDISRDTRNSVNHGSHPNFRPSTSANLLLSAQIAVDNRSTSQIGIHDAPRVSCRDPHVPVQSISTRHDYGELNFANQFGIDPVANSLDTRTITKRVSSDAEHYSTPAAESAASPPSHDENNSSDSTVILSSGSGSHDCYREAYDILGNLSFSKTNEARGTISAPGSALTSFKTANNVPLDHILQLNRESSKRLDILLRCPCARHPQLALLYASILSYILMRYQQAQQTFGYAVGSDSTARSSTRPWPHSEFSLLSSSMASMRANTTDAGLWDSASAPSVAVEPAPVTVGTFNVDDEEMQSVLTDHLLLGEMRSMSRLIDQFASQGPVEPDMSLPSDVVGLYKSLGSWLRDEHSRITEVFRSRLREKGL